MQMSESQAKSLFYLHGAVLRCMAELAETLKNVSEKREGDKPLDDLSFAIHSLVFEAAKELKGIFPEVDFQV